MTVPKTNLTVECPECESPIQFTRKPQLGTFVVCDECGETLEVVNVAPLQLSWAFDEDDFDYEEDDIDDDDEDEDDVWEIEEDEFEDDDF
jgi:lysine biosynthesis protein LysW